MDVVCQLRTRCHMSDCMLTALTPPVERWIPFSFGSPVYVLICFALREIKCVHVYNVLSLFTAWTFIIDKIHISKKIIPWFLPKGYSCLPPLIDKILISANDDFFLAFTHTQTPYLPNWWFLFGPYSYKNPSLRKWLFLFNNK